MCIRDSTQRDQISKLKTENESLRQQLEQKLEAETLRVQAEQQSGSSPRIHRNVRDSSGRRRQRHSSDSQPSYPDQMGRNVQSQSSSAAGTSQPRRRNASSESSAATSSEMPHPIRQEQSDRNGSSHSFVVVCLLYTSPSPRDATLSRMPSSA